MNPLLAEDSLERSSLIFSEKQRKSIYENVVCCSRDWRFKGGCGGWFGWFESPPPHQYHNNFQKPNDSKNVHIQPNLTVILKRLRLLSAKDVRNYLSHIIDILILYFFLNFLSFVRLQTPASFIKMLEGGIMVSERQVRFYVIL